jgi:hypothetical protein
MGKNQDPGSAMGKNQDPGSEIKKKILNFKSSVKTCPHIRFETLGWVRRQRTVVYNEKWGEGGGGKNMTIVRYWSGPLAIDVRFLILP